jgi:antitoxin HigA-1
MPMKDPPHPGRLIKDDIETLGLSVAQAVEGLGITRQQLYCVIKGECAISAEMACAWSVASAAAQRPGSGCR